MLINGRHTLTALGDTTGGPIWLQEEEIVVENLKDGTPDWQRIGALYASYDRNLARSLNEIYQTDPRFQQSDLTATQRNKLGGAMVFLATGFQQTFRFSAPAWMGLLKNAHIRLAMMDTWKEEMLAFVQGTQHPTIGRPKTRGLLRNAAVLSIALATYRYQPKQHSASGPPLRPIVA